MAWYWVSNMFAAWLEMWEGEEDRREGSEVGRGEARRVVGRGIRTGVLRERGRPAG